MVGFNKNIILYLLVFSLSGSPLQAMEDEDERKKITSSPLRSNVVANEERTFPHFKSVVLNAGAKAVLGIGLLYEGEVLGWQSVTHPSYNPHFSHAVGIVEVTHIDDSMNRSLLEWGSMGCSVVGINLLASAMNELGSYLYVKFKKALTQNRLTDLNSELQDTKKKIKKAQINVQINNLSTQDPREGARLFFRAFDHSVEIALAPFWILRLFDIMSSNRGGYSDIYTLFPEFSPYFGPSEKINLVPTILGLISLGWSVQDLISYLKGGTMGPNSPARSFLKACSSASTSKAFDGILQQEVFAAIRKNNIDFTKAGVFDVSIPRLNSTYLYKGFYCLRIGQSFEHFLKALKLVYDEREYWFGLVDELANDGSTPTELQKYQVKQPETNKPIEKIEIKSLVPKQKKTVFSNPVSTYDSFDSVSHSQPDTIVPKNVKIKTRREPYKQVEETTKNNSHDFQPVNASPNKDEHRRKILEKIEEMRSRPSVNKKEINKFLNNALKFVKGEVEGAKKNKVTITWKRGKRERSVFFENPHKQPNDKTSAFTGHKLRMALDALEQVYLDGWEKEKIIFHLNGRYSLYNLPHRLYEVLWTDLGEK